MIDSLVGKEVVVSGDFRADFGFSQSEMEAMAREAGAIVTDDVRSTTDVLVRGRSKQYKHGGYGTREVKLARRVRSAVVTDGQGLIDLFEGRSARAWPPNQPPPEQTAQLAAESSVQPGLQPNRLGTAFETLDTSISLHGAQVFERDPDAVEQSLRSHREVLNKLAAEVVSAGFRPLRAHQMDCAFDLAWETPDGITVVEVKSLTDQNERAQMRLGLGQVLDYADWLDSHGWQVARIILAVERAPSDPRWVTLCGRHGVTVVWPGAMRALFDNAELAA